MKYLLLIMSIFLFVSVGCAAPGSQSFFINSGSKNDQVGYQKVDDSFEGPVAITENSGNIYILDDRNFKVNVYSRSGQMVDTYKIPKGFQYYNLAVTYQLKIILTDKGVYNIQKDRKFIQISPLPDSIHTPYSSYLDDVGNIAISGLGQNGCVAGIINKEKKFEVLKGSNVYLTKKGLIGMQTVENSKEYLCLMLNKKIAKRVLLDSNFILIGFDDNMSIYFVEPPSKGKVKIRKIDAEGKTVVQEVEFDSSLFYDSVIYQKFFCVTSSQEVLMLNYINSTKKFKVTAIKF